MEEIISKLESILFLATKPFSLKQLQKALNISAQEAQRALEMLGEKYNREGSGIKLIVHEGSYRFSTAPEHANLIESVFNAEMQGDLTKPALETLTIIAYRGPVTKPELELIRGINCSLILRNLAMRGLVAEDSKGGDDIMAKYQVTQEFLQFLGVTSVKELPQYDELHSHKLIAELLAQRTQ